MKKTFKLIAEYFGLILFSVIMTLLVIIAVFGLDQLSRVFNQSQIFIQ